MPIVSVKPRSSDRPNISVYLAKTDQVYGNGKTILSMWNSHPDESLPRVGAKSPGHPHGKCVSIMARPIKPGHACCYWIVECEWANYLWICGQTKATVTEGIVWEFQGIFTSERLAIAACRDASYFIASVAVDCERPEKTTPFPGCYYPLAQTTDQPTSDKMTEDSVVAHPQLASGNGD